MLEATMPTALAESPRLKLHLRLELTHSLHKGRVSSHCRKISESVQIRRSCPTHFHVALSAGLHQLQGSERF